VQAASPALADARRLADQGRLEEAATIAGALAEHADARIEALELLGSVRLAQGRGDSARECFRRLVYLVPGHEAGLLQLALLSEQDGDHEAAERYRERARRAAAREAVE
jgi:chemotaxis protein methyltransferase WspC